MHVENGRTKLNMVAVGCMFKNGLHSARIKMSIGHTSIPQRKDGSRSTTRCFARSLTTQRSWRAETEVRSIGGKKKTRKWEISRMGKWRSWPNRGMREILLLVELDVNPTWINKKGEAEKKFFLADIKLGKSWIYRNVYQNVLNPNVLRASVETDRSWQRHCGLEITDEGTIGYKMKKGKFRQGKIPTYSRASADESQADRQMKR